MLQVMRIYGSASYYGDNPRDSAWDAPREVQQSAHGGRSVHVQLGAPVEWAFAAARRGRAYSQAMLEGMFGARGKDGVLERRMDELLAVPDLFARSDEHNWYVSVWAERREMVPADRARDYFGLPDPFATDDIERAATKDLLDRAAGAICLALHVEPLVVVMSDRLIVSGPGIAPYMVPRPIVGSASVSLGRMRVPKELLDRTLAGFPRSARRLDKSIRWYVAAIEEGDPIKRFLWAFLALEILIQSSAPPKRGQALANIRARSQIGLAEALFHTKSDQQLAVRFAYLAYALFPDDADDDCRAFESLVGTRNSWSHGRGNLSEQPPGDEVMRLFGKYARTLLTTESDSAGG